MNIEIEDDPFWKNTSSTTYLQNIYEFIQKHKVSTHFDAVEEIKIYSRFIYACNLGENLGVQNIKDIQHVLAFNLKHTNEEKETYNLFLALKYVKKLHLDMCKTGIITVEQIKDVHAILMKGLITNNGELRQSFVYTTTKLGEKHVYPSPLDIEYMLYDALDRHNKNMDEIYKYRNKKTRICNKMFCKIIF